MMGDKGSLDSLKSLQELRIRLIGHRSRLRIENPFGRKCYPCLRNNPSAEFNLSTQRSPLVCLPAFGSPASGEAAYSAAARCYLVGSGCSSTDRSRAAGTAARDRSYFRWNRVATGSGDHKSKLGRSSPW